MVSYNPKNKHYMFIITFGRSGSTLLQRLLNSHSDFLIRGENHALPMRLFGGLSNMKQSKIEFGTTKDDPGNPFFGLSYYSDNNIDNLFGKFLDDVIIRNDIEASIVGYKEIRYGLDFVELSNYMYYLRHLLPKINFVFLYRNIEDVVQSGWWKETTGAAGILNNYVSMMRAAQEEHRDVSIAINYEYLKTDIRALKDVEDLTGRKFNKFTFDMILSSKIGI